MISLLQREPVSNVAYATFRVRYFVAPMLETERMNKAHLGVRHSDKEFQASPTEICHISRLLCGFPACQSGVFLLADRWFFIFQVLAKLYS